MRRLIVVLASVVCLLCSVAGQASVQASADVIARSGSAETVIKGAAVSRDGFEYVSLQDTAPAFGAAAYWIQDAIVMRLLTAHQSVELTVGEQIALVDGQPLHMDAPPIKVDSKLYVTVSALTELLGVDADWSGDRTQLRLSESLPRLVGMHIEALSDGRQAVVLTLSKPVTGKLTEALLTEPDRYYVDIPGVRIGLSENDRTLKVDDEVLRSVRASQNSPDPPTVRVVLDLNQSFRYWARRDPSNYRRIIIEPAFRIYGAELIRNADGGLIRITSDGGPLQYQINYYLEPDRIVVDLMNAFLVRGAFEVRNDDHYFVSCIRASQNQTNAVRIVIELRRSYPFTPYVTPGKPNELNIAFGRMLYPPEIRETATSVDIVIKSSQENRGSIWTDPPGSDKMRLAIDFEDSFFGFDPSTVSIENDLIAGFRAGRFDGHTVRMVFDLKRFNGYTIVKGADTETIVRLPRTRQSSLLGKTIVIDPGHGSFPSQDPNGDPGADRTLDGKVIYEKDLNLQVALKLRDMLTEAGANVVMTRDTDTGLSLAERYRVANREQADAFISIHHNSTKAEWTETSGIEIYHKTGDAASKKLAEALGQSIPKMTGQKLSYVGVHRAFLLGVLEGSRVPSVLTELGFMSCKEELKRLVTDAFQNEAAKGILNGLVSYFSGQSADEPQPSEDASQQGVMSGADLLAALTSNLPDIDVEQLEAAKAQAAAAEAEESEAAASESATSE
jgi:N-acetylmuramoyl-L-alanine amidase